jgi:hypothetical protein
LADLANSQRDLGVVYEWESFIYTTFASAKGGGEETSKTVCRKGVKIMAMVDCHGLPSELSRHLANHHEATLVRLRVEFHMI